METKYKLATKIMYRFQVRLSLVTLVCDETIMTKVENAVGSFCKLPFDGNFLTGVNSLCKWNSSIRSITQSTQDFVPTRHLQFTFDRKPTGENVTCTQLQCIVESLRKFWRPHPLLSPLWKERDCLLTSTKLKGNGAEAKIREWLVVVESGGSQATWTRGT